MDHTPDISFEKDPYHHARRVFFTKWKPYVLRALDFDRSTRFGKFKKQLPITEKVLLSTLNELICDGLIEKTSYSGKVLHTEYSLTQKGREVCVILQTIYEWGHRDMLDKDLPIDPLGEMWHGFRDPDANVMENPYRAPRAIR